MSRIGKQAITILENVNVNLDNGKVLVKGQKGELNLNLPEKIEVEIKDKKIIVKSLGSDKKAKSLHGLYRTLINNMIIGVDKGFAKELELVGTGYRVKLEGVGLNISVGFSHPVKVEPPEGIKFELEGEKFIKVIGIDKILVGQIAANIRAIRKPEPYKGKGIRYKGEFVRRKAGKQVKGAS